MSGYGKEYYAHDCVADYHDRAIWESVTREKAKRIIETFNPKTVLDVGCAFGYTVQALREQGVEAWGIDNSSYAIGQAAKTVQPYLRVASACEDLPVDMPQKYDLVINIEVLEHLSEEDGQIALAQLCRFSDVVLFSSSDEDYDNHTHLNVQKPEYWAKRFAAQGFYANHENNVSFISPVAVCFSREVDIVRMVESVERYLRIYKSRNAQGPEIISKVYFNCGGSITESLCESYTMPRGSQKKIKTSLPQNCTQVRFDPEEGLGCLVSNVHIRTNQGACAVSSCNGIQLCDLYLFDTTDPQILINLPEKSDLRWIEIEANVLPVEQFAWAVLCKEIRNMQTAVESLTETIQAKEHSSSSEIKKLEDKLHMLLDDLDDKQGEADALHSQIEDYSRLVMYERANAEKDKQALAAILSSRVWRATAPVRKFKDCAKWIFHKRNTAPAVAITPAPNVPAIMLAQSVADSENKAIQLRITDNPVDPIRSFLLDEPVKRLNLVTDTIDAGSLLGGVATALIVATEFANRYGYELRIITRKADANPLDYQKIMKVNGIRPAKNVSYYSDWNRFTSGTDFKMELCPSDVFVATSWWSAQAIAATTIRKRFFYIIQEVETFFYNYGDEHLLCTSMMRNPDIDYIVSSGYLYRYFQEHEPMICAHSTYFEQAFSENLYSGHKFESKTHYKLFFYACPNNPRNLFKVGVQMLNRAIEQGILDTKEWDIYCVGQNVPEITFCNGSHAVNLGQLSWAEYTKFLANMDIGLCLMYTPHPGYPPYDVACSGGVVLSNKMLNKTSFDACKNVLLSDLGDEAFMESFRNAVTLAKDPEQRKKNYETNTICRDWTVTLQDTMSYMGGIVEDV